MTRCLLLHRKFHKKGGALARAATLFVHHLFNKRIGERVQNRYRKNLSDFYQNPVPLKITVPSFLNVQNPGNSRIGHTMGYLTKSVSNFVQLQHFGEYLRYFFRGFL